MTYGDKVREIKKNSLLNEIKNLQFSIRSILNNDPNAGDSDPDVKAYKQVLAEKQAEYEKL